MNAITQSQRTAARVAGLVWLVSLAFVLVANFGLRAGLLVRGDAAETIRRVAAAEQTFRLSIVFDLVYAAGVVTVLAALYVVLAPVNRFLALLAASWKFVYAVTAMLMALSLRAVLRLAVDPIYLDTLGTGPLHGVLRLNTTATGVEYYVGLAFWSLSSTLLGWLWLKSGYVPAALAFFGLAASAWCVLCTFAYLLDPAFAQVVNLWWFDLPMAAFDIVLSGWLLIRGLPRPTPAVGAAVGGSPSSP